MRFTVFLALVVATFIACISITNAEALPETGRNLRAQQIGTAGAAATKLFKSDDIAAKTIEHLNEKKTDKLTKMVAASVKKNPGKWPKIKKILLYSLGAAVAGTIIYQVGKANGQSAATTTAAGFA
ncbi:hypothetical protein PR001_g18162 [Phytophthora rubi]|uniref:RxLR effector protein n=1 Tax=Phytophthora rubi TaxID=129364 RepID=A0A6A3JLY4_9STRA|nr:hypothetical protein PR002_g19464 [Phytophthora rubi]KAE9002760.1 hypothetical protein PR001_g18162 [Phytophthora rubi]